MKNILVSLLPAAFILATVGCASTQEMSIETPDDDTNTAEESSVEPENTEESGVIEVDEGLLTVDVTLSESFLGFGSDEELTQEDVDDSVEEQGYLGGTLNDDGSVTYTMTKVKQREMLDEIKSDFDASIGESISEYPNVKSVTRNDDLSEITVSVTEEDLASSFLALGFAFYAGFYQSLEGKEFSTDIVFEDAATGEELSRATYPLED